MNGTNDFFELVYIFLMRHAMAPSPCSEMLLHDYIYNAKLDSTSMHGTLIHYSTHHIRWLPMYLPT